MRGNDGQAEVLGTEGFLMGLLFPSVHEPRRRVASGRLGMKARARSDDFSRSYCLTSD